jgi:hypothetical protein
MLAATRSPPLAVGDGFAPPPQATTAIDINHSHAIIIRFILTRRKYLLACSTSVVI